jgi:tetratricopeptide (TPR) repeat protein
MVASVERSRDPTAAEAASREALEVVRSLHGDRHALFGSSALYLADIQSDMLKFAEAERNYKLAAQVDDLTNEPNSDLRTQLDLRYGLFLVDQGRVNEGQPRLERVLANSIAVHGAQDRAYTAWAHENLARVWMRRGDLARARAEIDAAVEIYRHGRPDAILAKSLETQFDVMLKQDKPSDAAAVLDSAIAAREASATLTEPGFREGILLRQAQIALAKREYSQATILFDKVAGAAMPSGLRFRRYHYDAVLGEIAADLALDQLDRAAKSADALLEEFQQQGQSPAFALQAAEAAMLIGQTQAARGRCDLAKRSIERSADILRADQDAQSFRLIELARVRANITAIRCR